MMGICEEVHQSIQRCISNWEALRLGTPTRRVHSINVESGESMVSERWGMLCWHCSMPREQAPKLLAQKT